MKINRVQIFSGARLFFRLCWPATVFIGFCTGLLLPFNLVLQMLDQSAPGFIGVAWLLLLIVYIILGVAFTRLTARLLRRSFGSEEWRIQKRVAFLSGLPFYLVCLLFLTEITVILLDANLQSYDMIGAVFALAIVGCIGFALISCCYVFLVRFFLRRSTAIAHQ